MNIAGLRAWLGRQVSDSIAADDVATQVVTLGEGEFDLGPARDIVAPVAHFEGEVPNHAPIRLLALVRMLTNSTLVALYHSKQIYRLATIVKQLKNERK